MLDGERLLAALERRGASPEKAAKALGMSPGSFCRKLSSGSFGIQEADRLVKLFKIERPGDIFFAEK